MRFVLSHTRVSVRVRDRVRVTVRIRDRDRVRVRVRDRVRFRVMDRVRVLLPLQSTMAPMNMVLTIDIGRHKQRAGYACIY